MKKLILAAALSAASSMTANAADYKIDTDGAHAFVQFKISHLGYSWLYGRFNTFDGQFSYDAAKLAESEINLVIDTASVDSNHAERDKHLRSGDFLNVSKHPKATFNSTKVVAKEGDKFDLYGNLTLNGVTKEVVINAEKLGEGSDPWGGYRAGFAGTTSFELKDFGINYDLGPASSTVYLDLTVEGIRL
ncbi:YceI family protein [Arsukibacterium indicum]|uniref:YceI family protein n=1 Tax=Arsukibacterium indicum TaxID=2848612 RepID=A0ABS6MM41_9GAMM|nr:YceI family protein [Arsukibacterium indicum]MBV2129894.1 YceI family protein [Arsukibacterium indicum]